MGSVAIQTEDRLKQLHLTKTELASIGWMGQPLPYL